ncbi:MAG: ABC transporter permease [Clostridia bacterium]|nr:ABC transporter permease [Clostridia bacterium]
MVLILGSLQQGFIYALLALGIYISFRILNIPDLTAEGSFTFGLAVSASVTVLGHPFLGIILSIAAGAAAGTVTGIIQTKIGVHPVLAGILTMSGLYSINLMVMNKSSNLSLIANDTVFKITGRVLNVSSDDAVKLAVSMAVLFAVLVLVIVFFRMQLGLCIRATGDNEAMVRASSIDVDNTKIFALALSNSLIALSGGLLAQYQGFADINSGVGILVVGLASVIIGEAAAGKRGVALGFVSSVIGSIVYRFIVALAINFDIFPAFTLKLVSAVIVGIALSVPEIRAKYARNKIRREGLKNAEN